MNYIKKRNGDLVPFDSNKIKNAISKAFFSCQKKISNEELDAIVGKISVYDGKEVEKIQDDIEDYLIDSGYKNEAKAFIKYRGERAEDRDIQERIDYMEEYCNTGENAATASETDPNANVAMKNVANLEGEVYKTKNRRIQRRYMKNKLNEMFPDVANNYEEDLNNHIIYVHDEAVSPVCKHYTYSPFECVEAIYNGCHYLLGLKSLYCLVQCKEVLENETEEVWCKYPIGLQIKDKTGWVNVTRLTRKKKQRDLYRVKTAFGEDIVVTDNHPMIISDDQNNTIEAINCLNEKQYRIENNISFEGVDTIDLSLYVECDKVCSNFIATHEKGAPYYYAKRYLKLDRSLGYVIGFFIGDGNYDNTFDVIMFSQKERETLIHLEESLFESFGVVSYETIGSGNSSNNWIMKVCSKIVSSVFRNYFGIKDKSSNKCLPTNILMFNEDFAKGIIEGLIDSDGTVQNESTISIRLSSRECITQLTKLLRYFGYGVGNQHQATPFGNNHKIKTNYDLWGILFTNQTGSVKFDGSYKWNQRITTEVIKSLKYSTGWSNITNVDKIDNGSFLEKCDYIYDITTESGTFDCNNLWVHNCNAVSLYPLMLDGIGPLDGVTPYAPNDLQSFSGQITNLIFLLSSQCKGAVGVSEYLIVLNFYIIKEYGNDWYNRLDEVVTAPGVVQQRTIKNCICKAFKQFLYGINQVAGNRSFQSPFTNLSYFDKTYFFGLFKDFMYPDGTKPEWEAVDCLQRLFMKFFNKLRLTQILTFPVETMCMVYDPETKDIIDKSYKDFTAEMYAEGHSFFTYISDSVDSVSNCCRLQSKLQKNTFNPTSGLTGVMTGSCNVITLNMNRIIQDWYYYNHDYQYEDGMAIKDVFKEDKYKDSFKEYLTSILDRVYKYHIAYKTMLYELEDKGMIASSKTGYIKMSKLYCTIGINGLNEAAQFMRYDVSNNDEYIWFLQFVLSIIKEENEKHSIREGKPFIFNSEIVPAEGLGGKNYRWDKRKGYWTPSGINLYNSYFYNAHDNTSVLDKFVLHGKKTCQYTDGGSALHCNLEEHLDKEQYLKLIDFAIENGTNYFTFNIPNSKCEDCGYITKHPIEECPKCHSENISQYTRVIGYLRPVSNFGKDRQIEAKKRVYSNL